MKAIASLFAAALILGCGASDTQTDTADDEDIDFSPEDDAIFGDAPPSGALEEEPLEEEGSQQVAVGPAEVTIETKLGVETTNQSQVTVRNQAGTQVASGRGGETFSLQAGTYTVTATVSDEDLIIGAPVETTETITVEPEEPQTEIISIPAAHVTLTVRRGGRNLGNVPITLYREGTDEEVASLRASGREITIRPGRYEAKVRTGNQEIRVEGLMFMGGARQNIPVNIQ